MRRILGSVVVVVVALWGAGFGSPARAASPELVGYGNWEQAAVGPAKFFCNATVSGDPQATVHVDKCKMVANGEVLAVSAPSIDVANYAATVPAAASASGDIRVCWRATAVLTSGDTFSGHGCSAPL